jgi:membrane protease YdiL (CAAX protease family)
VKNTLFKFLAVIEVIFVAFIFTPYLTLGLYRLFPGFEIWQAETGFPVPILFYIVSVAIVLLLALVRRKRLEEYGINFRNLKYQIDIMLTCFLPVALVSGLHAIIVDPNSWGGAPILIASYIALLLVLAWLLRKKPAAGAVGLLGAGIVLMPGLTQVTSVAWKAVVLFSTYAVFVGFGEEILYRGYIQSRLNENFDRRWKFSGVAFGMGAFITNILFGLMHVGIQRWILGINIEVTLAWGFWTIFSGLVFSFVREKSGSIIAPALLHGLPQAIASVAMLFLQAGGPIL